MTTQDDLLKLQQLIKSLKSAEIEIIKRLIDHSKPNYLKTNKQQKLFFLLLNKEKIEYDKAKRLVSKETTDYGFNKLIVRLKDRVLESLYLDVNINRGRNTNIAFKIKLRQKKLLVAAFMLHSRGMIDQSLELYDEVIYQSKKYELYDDLLESLYIKQGLIGLSKGIEGYEQLSKDIIFYEDCRITYYNAKDWYRSFYAEVDFKGLKNIDYKKKLIKYIDQLAMGYSRTRSTNVKMYQYLLEMELFQQLEDYDKVDQVGRSFVDFVRASRAIYGRERVGSIYSQLAENKLKSLDFKTVLTYCKEGLKFFKNKNLNYYGLKELEIEGLYYLGNLQQLKEMVSELSEHSFYKQFDYRRTKLRYYLGVIYFLQGDFKQAKSEFNDTREIEKDKEGWNVWIRIMRILCNIEMSKYNLIDYDIDSFRKYIERTSNRGDVRGRDELILKTLVTLERKSFNFTKAYKINKPYLDDLQSMKDLHRWRVDSPELIIYNQWYFSKMIGVAYQPDFNPYKKYMQNKMKKLKEGITNG
jgi:tetratricopeptide (TPR) repeat protein